MNKKKLREMCKDYMDNGTIYSFRTDGYLHECLEIINDKIPLNLGCNFIVTEDERGYPCLMGIASGWILQLYDATDGRTMSNCYVHDHPINHHILPLYMMSDRSYKGVQMILDNLEVVCHYEVCDISVPEEGQQLQFNFEEGTIVC